MKNTNILSSAAFRKNAVKYVQTALAVLVTVVMLFPLYWMVNTALKPTAEVLTATPTFWPSKLQWSNFTDAWTSVDYPRYIINTIYVTFWHLIIQLTLGILAAYGFARGTFPLRNTLFLVVLSAMMIPAQAVFIPIYVMIANLGWIDTFAGLIFPGTVGAGMIFMLRQNFMSVDQSYLDAGEVDGLGIFGTIWHVLMPMCKASVVTVTLNSFIGGWNNYFWPKLISKTDATRPIAIALAKMRGMWEEVGGSGFYNTLMAGAIISIIPVIIVFVLNQKHLMKGYSKNAMK